MQDIQDRREFEETCVENCFKSPSCVQLSKSHNTCSGCFVKALPKFLAYQRSESDGEAVTTTQDVKTEQLIISAAKDLEEFEMREKSIVHDRTYVHLAFLFFFLNHFLLFSITHAHTRTHTRTHVHSSLQ